MRKLRLSVDEIHVVGFEPVAAEEASRGTVMGEQLNSRLCPTNNEDPTCRLGSCYSGNPCSYCP